LAARYHFYLRDPTHQRVDCMMGFNQEAIHDLLLCSWLLEVADILDNTDFVVHKIEVLIDEEEEDYEEEEEDEDE